MELSVKESDRVDAVSEVSPKSDESRLLLIFTLRKMSAVLVTVGFPDTPSPLATEIPVPATIDLFAQVSVPVRTPMPVPLNPSTAARSFAKPKTKFPVVVIGEPEIVRP